LPFKLAYVAPRWDYGDPDRGLSLEEVNFHTALRGMGHEIHHYDFLARHNELGPAAMNAELREFVSDLQPDLAMFCLFTDEISLETISGITRAGITTYNWFADDHWRYESFSRRYAPAFSLVSTTDAAAVPKYHADGYSSVVLTQWACNPFSYGPRSQEIRYDVTFVGQPYGDRSKAMKMLRRSGVNVACWGHGWEAGRLDHEAMVEVFGASRINLNFSKAYRGRPWRRRALTYQIKARPFEVAGCGGFVLTEDAPRLDRYFEPGREIAVFRNLRELVDQVHHWLEADDERAGVARAGYERVLREHTYDRRFEEIFRAAGLYDR
jgi:spore maturation protein CgeB